MMQTARYLVHSSLIFGGLCFALAATSIAQTPQIRLEEKEDRVSVYVDDELFTEYIFKGFEKPILYPIIGPKGIGMTRNYPMKPGVPNEAEDHPHHKGIWFGHMEVGGESFWHSGPTAGTTVQTSLQTEGNKIKTTNDLIGKDGKLVATDSREISFGAEDGKRFIDYTVTYHASQRDILFGDNKDGQMGIRMHPALRIKGPIAVGQAVNSEGVTTKEIWGKRAKWIDYWGNIDGTTVGIAMFDHPSNFRYPTWWHARDYGLLSANPFGRRDFEGESAEPGDHLLPQGESLTFKHRFVIHSGDSQAANIDSLYQAWAH